MAVKEGTFLKCNYNELKAVVLDAVDATDGIKFSKPVGGYSDEDLILVIKNDNTSEAKNVKVIAPTDGSYAAADTDLVLSVPAEGIAVARIESAKYANNDGSILVKGDSADIKIQAVIR